MNKKLSRLVAVLSFVQFTSISCDEAPESSATSDVQVEIGENQSTTIAKLTMPDGNELEFIDEGDGTIGFMEGGPLDSMVIGHRLIAEHDASALEVFQALVPDQIAPNRLFEAHQKRFSNGELENEEPRDLSESVQEFRALSFGSTKSINCGPTTEWWAEWMQRTNFNTEKKWAIDAPPSNKRCSNPNSSYIWNLPSYHNFYPGNGANLKTFIGACVGVVWPSNGNNSVEFKIERRSGSSWSEVKKRELDGDPSTGVGKYYVYSTNSLARHRGRVRSINEGISKCNRVGLGTAHTPWEI